MTCFPTYGNIPSASLCNRYDAESGIANLYVDNELVGTKSVPSNWMFPWARSYRDIYWGTNTDHVSKTRIGAAYDANFKNFIGCFHSFQVHGGAMAISDTLAAPKVWPGCYNNGKNCDGATFGPTWQSTFTDGSFIDSIWTCGAMGGSDAFNTGKPLHCHMPALLLFKLQKLI